MKEILLVGLCAGLAALDRKGVAQLLLSRPIVLCTVMGMVVGQPENGLRLGLVLELVYLGAVNMGAALPENEVVAASIVAPAGLFAARTMGSMSLSLAALALLCALPAGKLGRIIDERLEILNDRLAVRVRASLDSGAAENALRWNLAGLLPPFLATTACALLAAIVVAPILVWVHVELPMQALIGLDLATYGALGVGFAAALHSLHQKGAAIWAAGAAIVGSYVLGMIL